MKPSVLLRHCSVKADNMTYVQAHSSSIDSQPRKQQAASSAAGGKPGVPSSLNKEPRSFPLAADADLVSALGTSIHKP